MPEIAVATMAILMAATLFCVAVFDLAKPSHAYFSTSTTCVHGNCTTRTSSSD